jgi:anaerobic selenocysteine-containing dehydrogenase
MANNTATTRRQFIKIGCAAIAAIPLLALASKASATTNAGMRSSMKYQDKPNAEKDCAGCLQFVPGKAATDIGGCKLFPGDTEISPKGYCVAWAAKPK